MHSRNLSKLVVLLLGATLGGCGQAPSATAREQQAAILSNGVNATLSAPSSWSTGCASVTLVNTSTSRVTNWSVVVALSDLTLRQVTGASYTASGGQVTVRPSRTGVIAPGASVSFGVCANPTGVSPSATLRSLNVTGGSTAASYTLTMQVSGSGTTIPAAGVTTYTAGAVVQVTATPASGQVFAGWSGAATGTTNPVAITMDGNKALTATFSPAAQGALSINAGGSASGDFLADAYYSGGSTYTTSSTIDTSSIAGTAPAQAVFQTERYGEFTYTIGGRTAGSAQAVTLYFQESYWTAAGQRTFDVAINGATALTAFDIYAAAGGSNKAVARTFNTTASSTGQVVIAFTKGGGPDNPKVCGISVVAGAPVSTYPLTVSKSGTGGGTVSGGAIACGATCSASLASGTVVTLTATPDGGSAFGGWGGACSGTGSCVVTMHAARTVTASFAANPVNPTVSVNAGGSGSGDFVADAYFSGGSTYSTTRTIDTSLITGAVPAQAVFQTERYGEFTYTIPGLTPNSAQAVTLYFVESYWTAAGQRMFDVAINGEPAATAFDIFAEAGGANRAVARTFNTTASSSGQVVIQFTRGDGPDNPKVCGITVGEGTPSSTYSLAVSKTGTGTGRVTGGAIDCGSTCSAVLASGAVVTLTATPDAGSTFGGWGGACSGAGSCVVTMNAARAVSASFTRQGTSSYVVAMVQSSKAQATDLTTAEVTALVSSAVSQAGGLDFIQDGQTVVLKPNLLTAYTDAGMRTPASTTVNGISTDWRVVKAVADLVRARNPKGKILVMEGSVNSTTKAYSMLGYTPTNFGTSVDEFIALEGSSCADRTTGALEQRPALSGKQYWVNSRYVRADVVISLPVLKTHVSAGITGAVKNLGIGATPVGQYSAGTNASDDCTRGQTSAHIDHSTPEALGQFIRDYYSIRPADFVVMDALQGLAHGPLPAWDNSGTYDYASSRMNMRLILAGKNAVAVDTIAAQVMMCDPTRVPHLTKLASDGLGTTDAASITLVGKQVNEVARAFAGKQTDICPGKAPTPSTRPGGACQAGVSYPAPVLTGTPRLLYRPSGTVVSGTFEGPAWLAASTALLFSDISFTGSVNPSQLLRLTPGGTATTYLADAGVNGMAVDGSGSVYACSHKVQGIVKLNVSAGTLTTVVDSIGGKRFNSPNDLVVRSDGTIYFTDPDFQLGSRTSETGKKGVYRVSQSGTVSLIDDTFVQPNGIALSPDQTVLYVADYGANVVRTFSVDAAGSTSARKDFVTVSSPDGFAMDCLGNLYIASGSSGTIQVYSPAGTRLGSINVASSISNMAFGGADGKTLYITAGKALYGLDMNLPGYFD